MTISMRNVTLDCARPPELARFWSQALRLPLDPGGMQFFAAVNVASREPGNTDPGWFFITVPEGKQVKNRMHVDLISDERADDVARLVGLGATELSEHAEYGARWTVLADPEGNEFCIGDAQPSGSPPVE